MKLKKLKINSHHHLKDLEFDFTYPNGHPKAGQPLDKICFIGQSATGKTKILKQILDNVLYLINAELVNGVALWHAINYKKNSKKNNKNLICRKY